MKILFPIIFLFLALNLFAQNKVKKAEYWFNSNFSDKQTIALNAESRIDLRADIPVDFLPFGLQTIHFRVQDWDGNWSSAISCFFIKTELKTDTNEELIVGYEHWFDTDLKSRQSTSVSSGKNYVLSDFKDISTLNNGLHVIHFRFQDSSGRWSSSLSKFFLKKSEKGSTAVREVESFEYWFNSDYNSLHSGSVERLKSLNFEDQLDISDLGKGLHTLHYRFKDNRGEYSSATSRFFLILDLPVAVKNNKILAYRYWFNDSILREVILRDSTEQLILMDSLNMLNIPGGEYFVHLQFKDRAGKWSPAITDTVNKIKYLHASLSASLSKSCLGDSILFTSIVTDADSLTWALGDGTLKHQDSVYHQYEKNGTFDVSLTLEDTILHKERTFHFPSKLQVFNNPNLNLEDTVKLIDDESQMLDAGDDYAKYLWNNTTGERTFMVSASALGIGKHLTYLAVTDQNGCMADDSVIVIVSSSDGIDNPLNFHIKAYPNPATSYIAIEWDNPLLTEVEVNVINMKGSIVHNQMLTNRDKIHMNAYPKGSYLIQLRFKEKTFTIPISKL